MFQIIRYTTKYRGKIIIEVYKNWLKKNENVLDVGCGDGLMSSLLACRFGVKMTGCDIENYLKTEIGFVLMKNSYSLPFRKKSFDCVLFNDVLHHMSFDNQRLLIEEALRVGSKVLIFEVEPTPIGKAADYVINKFHNLHMDVPLTFREHSEWMLLFKELKVEYTFVKPAKSFFYPFTHQAFLLTKRL
jgi:ubiquinone/menaquinone biosynthesis C-methylase UbiE